MKIVHIVPGSGGTFYCQNCLRDAALVRALRQAGHDVIVVPMYLPLGVDAEGVEGTAPVFFGAIGLYLKERFPLLRRLPMRFMRCLDAPALLRWAAGMEGSTKAEGLGEMTLSMLRGEQGNQAADVAGLAAWLEREGRPDIVHLSNALLLGLAPALKQRLGAPVVCSLQDEDQWVEAMDEPVRSEIWVVMRRLASGVDAFASVSETYARAMQKRLDVPEQRMHVVYVGIDVACYAPAGRAPDPPVVGFLSRMSEHLGLGTLVEAFITLRTQHNLDRLRLRCAGGVTSADKKYVGRLRKRLARAGLAGDAGFEENLDRDRRVEFLRGLSVLSVPVPRGEAFGTYLLEAQACGVPVVQPRTGSFPEIVNLTGGGLLCAPGDSRALADALAGLLKDPERAARLGGRGRSAVQELFSVERMAERMGRLYNGVARKKRDGEQNGEDGHEQG